MTQEHQIPRKNVLTEADLAALAVLMKEHNNCNMGLTTDEVSTLKRLLGAFDQAAGIVGKVVLTALVCGLIALFTKGFWISMATGVKQVTK